MPLFLAPSAVRSGAPAKPPPVFRYEWQFMQPGRAGTRLARVGRPEPAGRVRDLTRGVLPDDGEPDDHSDDDEAHHRVVEHRVREERLPVILDVLLVALERRAPLLEPRAHVPGRLSLPPGGAGLRKRLTPLA